MPNNLYLCVINIRQSTLFGVYRRMFVSLFSFTIIFISFLINNNFKERYGKISQCHSAVMFVPCKILSCTSTVVFMHCEILWCTSTVMFMYCKILPCTSTIAIMNCKILWWLSTVVFMHCRISWCTSTVLFKYYKILWWSSTVGDCPKCFKTTIRGQPQLNYYFLIHSCWLNLNPIIPLFGAIQILWIFVFVVSFIFNSVTL